MVILGSWHKRSFFSIEENMFELFENGDTHDDLPIEGSDLQRFGQPNMEF